MGVEGVWLAGWGSEVKLTRRILVKLMRLSSSSVGVASTTPAISFRRMPKYGTTGGCALQRKCSLLHAAQPALSLLLGGHAQFLEPTVCAA